MPESKEDRERRQPSIPVCSVGTKSILAALPQPGCRVIIESSASVGSSYKDGVLGAGFIVKLALGKVMIDKEEQEAAVKSSACNWTILRPVKLTNKPARGNLKSGTSLRWNITSTATRADVAEYMVKILSETSTFRNTITLMN